ncbi:response regulator [Nostocaceae cyanobacterium CENA357]|uniref:histidine kinase n=1 Tax=Atlanticothrix silvestris CENA357 TaxID=1725252 RepID=A0A8J7L419_9CYAN|nr:ATP-binding protein [Atlanticothrix silvestris]MBH8553172.1 response regulator [Atlanticothrix silvestris CENA357]
MKAKILVVEDEGIIACGIKDCLEYSGYIVPAIAVYGEEAIEKVAEFYPDLVLMDIMLKGNMSGIEAAQEITTRFNIPIIYLTAYSDKNTLKKAKDSQPFGYIIKPFEEHQLITTIEIALNRHKVEMLMREALEKEKENRSIKSYFVSMVSHEFRNPLSNIFNYTELLASHIYKLNEVQIKEYIHQIQNAVKQLDHLLSDVLLIGKAEVGRDSFNPSPLDLEKFCQDLISEIQLGVGNDYKIIFSMQGTCTIKDNANSVKNSQSLTVKYRLPGLDKKLLRHIITNLLSNAIKYSPLGSAVYFDLFCVEGEAIFRIQDQGIGIPETDQENLFTSFHRGSNVGNIPGHGLGLAIVKHYVELHGGQIAYATKVGMGTTFIVSLPFHRN